MRTLQKGYTLSNMSACMKADLSCSPGNIFCSRHTGHYELAVCLWNCPVQCRVWKASLQTACAIDNKRSSIFPSRKSPYSLWLFKLVIHTEWQHETKRNSCVYLLHYKEWHFLITHPDKSFICEWGKTIPEAHRKFRYQTHSH